MQLIEHITTARERGWQWFAARAHGKHAVSWMAGLSFLEPVVSPIVAETLMAAMLLAGSDHKRWKLYALICSVASFLGGIAAYGMGMLLFWGFGGPFLAFLGLTDIAQRAPMLAGSTFIILFFATITPLPDKIFTVASGFFGVPFLPYILGYLFGRSARFFIVAYLVHTFGSKVLDFINRYSVYAALFALALIAVYATVHWNLLPW